jgi:hypothetical protein
VCYAKLLKESSGTPLLFTPLCKLTLLSKQCKLELWNCTHAHSRLWPWLEQLGVLYLQVWNVCVKERWKTVTSWKNVTNFSCLAFLSQHNKFLTKWCTARET